MRHPIRVLAISALAIGLAAAGCSKNSGGTDKGPDASGKKSVVIDYKGEAKTPAPEVPGAKPGGQLVHLMDGPLQHFDPQQIYVSNALSFMGDLVHRSLTGYIQSGDKDKPLTVVGDLATNAGEMSNGGKTWTYHLRNNIKFEDGSPITSADIMYGVGRSFGKYGAQGPQYLPNALQTPRVYAGPWGSPADLKVPGVTTPDPKTIVFNFAIPHPEMPYLAAMPTTTPVQAANDTKENYEKTFKSEGPYKLSEFKPDVSMTLVKNPNWDPASDPIRHQYLDSIFTDFTTNQLTQTQRLQAAQGTDANAVMEANVDKTLIAAVNGDPTLLSRAIKGPTSFVNYININTLRVTDLDVRKALNYAFDRDAYIKVQGGDSVVGPNTALLAPVVPGFQQYNAYDGGVNGNPDKAKELTKGKKPESLNLTFCYANSASVLPRAESARASLTKGGFTITNVPVDKSKYYDVIGKKDNTCDIMISGWSQDYPDADSTIGVLFDGTTIVAEGNQNYSYFSDEGINKKIADLRANPDREAAAKSYGALDKEIMEKFAPVIPTTATKFFALYGPKVGGIFLSPLYAQFNLTGAYIK